MTVKVYSRRSISRSPRDPPSTFLFLLIFNCQTTDTQSLRRQIPKSQTIQSGPKSAIQPIYKDFPERKPSSPAAPPPSFSERTYKSTHTNKSTNNFQKSEKLSNSLKSITYSNFRTPKPKPKQPHVSITGLCAYLAAYRAECERGEDVKGGWARSYFLLFCGKPALERM